MFNKIIFSLAIISVFNCNAMDSVESRVAEIHKTREEVLEKLNLDPVMKGVRKLNCNEISDLYFAMQRIQNALIGGKYERSKQIKHIIKISKIKITKFIKYFIKLIKNSDTDPDEYAFWSIWSSIMNVIENEKEQIIIQERKNIMEDIRKLDPKKIELLLGYMEEIKECYSYHELEKPNYSDLIVNSIADHTIAKLVIKLGKSAVHDQLQECSNLGIWLSLKEQIKEIETIYNTILSEQKLLAALTTFRETYV
ncbi:MAG: hypothetical protein P4L22_01560 [Candidatus Babeliales bacterium]|nr:hypothetical protein [Candidatus Babeliales bacterium]